MSIKYIYHELESYEFWNSLGQREWIVREYKAYIDNILL